MARPDGKDRGLFERPKDSGVWWIRYSDSLGQEHREKVGPKSMARKRYEQRKTEVRQNKFEPEAVTRRATWTIAKMLAHFREQRKILGPKNQYNDQLYVDQWTDQFGKYQLDQLKSAHIEEWRRKRTQEGLKPASINHALDYLRAYFNLAIKDGLCKENPVTKIKRLKVNNLRKRFLSQGDEYERLKAAMEPEEFDIVDFALHTGLRQTEQFKLEWSRVDLARKFILIHQTKAGKERVVPLNKTALDILGRQATRFVGSPWVFPAPNDLSTARNGPNFYKRTLKAACEKAKIQDLTWHDLRRSFGSWLALNDVSLYAVEKLMGHSNAQMIERYAHLSPSYLANAIDKLDT